MSSPEDGFDALPPEVRKDMDSLSQLGFIANDAISLGGHSFGLRTLYGDEELLVGLLTQEYQETLLQFKAWHWAHVSLALTHVDDDPDFCPPIGPNKRDYAHARWRHCTSHWFYPLARFLFTEYEELTRRQEAVFEAVRDLSPRSRPASSPTADSSNDLAPSELMDLLGPD